MGTGALKVRAGCRRRLSLILVRSKRMADPPTAGTLAWAVFELLGYATAISEGKYIHMLGNSC